MKIAVVGAYGVGRSYSVNRFPEAGETILAVDSDDSHGGKGSNQAVAAARLGATVSLFTALGDDAAAGPARALWAAEGIDASAVQNRPGPTMTGVIAVEPSGENRIIVSLGACAALVPDDLEAFRSRIEGADLLVVSLEIPLEVALRALDIAHAAGVRTLLNPAPAAEIPADALARVDIITPNQTETAVLTGEREPDAALARLRELTSATIVQTRGASGALVFAPDGSRTQVAARTPERVVDTTGAGDAFTAALAVALVSGLSPVAAATWAAAAGSVAVQTAGVIVSLPHIDHLPPLDLSGVRPGEETL